jgi:hypothetical protein
MKLIRESVEDIQYLTEDADGNKNYYIEGVFMQAEKGNKNKRIYPKHVLFREVDRYCEECIKTNRSLGELNHPQGPQINLERVSHKIIELRKDGTNIYGKAKILSTPYGQIVKNFIDEGVCLGVSSRGLGSLKSKGELQEVQNDFWLSTIDIVADPSAPDAFVEGIMEGKEWIWDNGIIKEKQINDYKESIEKASRQRLEETAIDAFSDFIRRLKTGK